MPKNKISGVKTPSWSISNAVRPVLPSHDADQLLMILIALKGQTSVIINVFRFGV